MGNEYRERLQDVHPELRWRVERILDALAALNHPAWVAEGIRSAKRQDDLYAQGRTTPGMIVTNVRSTSPGATHCPQADGFGHAVDLAFQSGEGLPLDNWSSAHPWMLLGAMARTLGLTWGGDWRTMKGDYGHVEWKG